MRGGRVSFDERETWQTRNGRVMTSPEAQSAVRDVTGSLASEMGERVRPGEPGIEDGLHDLHHDLREEIDPDPGENQLLDNLEGEAQTSPVTCFSLEIWHLYFSTQIKQYEKYYKDSINHKYSE